MRFSKGLPCLILILSLASAFMPGCSCGGFPVPELPSKVVGHCKYKNFFSGMNECKDYVGNWTKQEASDDCEGNESKLVADKKCGIAPDKRLGDCIFIIDEEKKKYARVELPGSDEKSCSSMRRGCEFFGGGSFVPTPICGGKTKKIEEKLPIFQQPERVCKAPKAGEKPGKGPDGKVCTWTAIAGATEEGRNFEYYGNCNAVRSQRPYFAVPPASTAKDPDPRMKEPAYVKESNWVKAQMRASACVCCHSTSAPKGPSNWYLESGPNWINSFYARGLAMGAGWINTVGFGAYAKELNNGFSRASPANPTHSAFPTTDDARMRRFFENELKHRGKTRKDFASETYGAGPLDAQRFYKPKDCPSKAQGIKADGTVTWSGGAARYVQVLEADANSPSAPPNLDLPKGTLWRIDVDWKKGTPINSGAVKYGVLPKGLKQAFPKEGKPKALVSGRKYYLYVQRDLINPITRCLFVAP